MQRRVPVQELRGSDLTLLEVQIPEMLRRPIGQLAPINLMDLIELSETEGRPKSMSSKLAKFIDHVERQVADMPKTGSTWTDFLAELADLPAERVPLRFRGILKDQCATRDAAPIEALLSKWEGVEPLAFPLNERQAKVTKMEAPKPRTPSKGNSTAPRESKGKKTKSTKKAAAPKITAKPIDAERQAFLEQLCLERLRGVSSSKGLSLTVLQAGVKHHAKSHYSNVSPVEINAALKGLESKGRAKTSAGRWMASGRW